MMILGVVWGQDFLIHTFHLTNHQSALLNSMIFLGSLMGFPLIGWLSDFFRSRRKSMMLGALLMVLVYASVVRLAGHNNFCLLALLFLLLGLLSSSQGIAYSMIIELNPVKITSTAMAFSNVLLMFLTATIQLFFSQLMMLKTQISNDFGVMSCILILLIVAIFLPFAIRQ